MDQRSGKKGEQLQDQSRHEKYWVAERRKLRGLASGRPLVAWSGAGHMTIHEPPGR